VKGDHIKYRRGYKYILEEDYPIQTPITGYLISSAVGNRMEYIELRPDGLLTLFKGFPSDGCSGPTIDDRTNMRAGFVHDAGYWLIRLGFLPESTKPIWDTLLETIMKEDSSVVFEDGSIEGTILYNLCLIRCGYYYEGVEHFGAPSAKYGTEPYPVQTAP
jgi:hypothetical protein